MPRFNMSLEVAPGVTVLGGADNEAPISPSDPIYDTPEGIESYLTDLAGLNQLIQDRAAAGYSRKESLHDFVILGKWSTDSCGNFGRCKIKLDSGSPNIAEKLPKVVRHADVFKLLKGLTINSDVQPDVPKPWLECPECHKGWTLETAHNTFVEHEDITVPLTPGKTIEERQHNWDNSPEGIFRFDHEPSVRNDKYIDMTPSAGGRNGVVNDKGWRHHSFPNERLSKMYVAEEGDCGSMRVSRYYHKRCHTLAKARRERAYFTEIFTSAEMGNAVLNEIKNEYCPCERCAPWFIARLPFGDIKIGWRKRVISIDWSSTKQNLMHLFKGEDVTLEPTLIHAYGREKAIAYLTSLRDALGGTRPPEDLDFSGL